MAEIAINPFGTSGELPANIGIVNDLDTGGANKALSAEQGKKLGDAAKTGMYMADGEDGPADIDITFDDGDIVSGVRIAGGVGGISAVTANAQRATVNKVYYCGEGDAPSGTEKFDLSKLKSFTSPSGFNASPTFAAGLGQNAAAVYPTGWQSGTYTFTDANRTAAEGKPYMVWNFNKGSGSENIGSSDIAALVAGFKITLEGESIEPVFTQHKAVSVVDEEGDEVFAMSSPSAIEGGETEIYSKDAVDGLLAGFTPGGSTADQSSKARRNLRVAHWNVGHFYLGRNMADGNFIFRTDGENLQKAFTNKVQQIAADVFMMCEWYTCTQSEAIFSNFPYSDTSVGSGNTREYAFKSNFKLNSVEIVNFGVNNLPNETFKVAEITMGDETIALIECHLYFSGVFAYSSDKTYRAAEIQAILNYVSTQGYDRVIIAGDFNNGKPNDTLDEGPHEMDAFKTAGYKMFNFDFCERVNTYPATGTINSNYTPLGLPSIAIDNIICKGCSIVAANVVDDGRLTDHCCVVCDIVLDDLTE